MAIKLFVQKPILIFFNSLNEWNNRLSKRRLHKLTYTHAFNHTYTYTITHTHTDTHWHVSACVETPAISYIPSQKFKNWTPTPWPSTLSRDHVWSLQHSSLRERNRWSAISIQRQCRNEGDNPHCSCLTLFFFKEAESTLTQEALSHWHLAGAWGEREKKRRRRIFFLSVSFFFFHFIIIFSP